MKMIAPNIARPMTKPSPLATRNTDDRNRPSGMIGSSARRSCQTNAASSAAAASARPTTSGEPHAYSLPPHVVTRTSALTPAVSSVAPT